MATEIEELAAQLRSADKDSRIRVIYRLGQLDDFEVANTAVLGLSRNKRLARDPLLLALRDQDSVMRAHAAHALGFLYDPSTVELLIDVLADPVPEVRYRAIGALRQLGDSRALPALEQLAREDRARTAGGTVIAEEAARAIREIKE